MTRATPAVPSAELAREGDASGAAVQYPGADAKRGARRIALGYAAFAALWILLSDRALGLLFRDPEAILGASIAKGWLFVAISALLLYGLLVRLVGQIEQSHRREVALDSGRRHAEERVHNLSFYDALTGLPARRLLIDRLGQSLRSRRRNDGHGAVLFIDLDGFRALNDTRGHEAGDRLRSGCGSRAGCARPCPSSCGCITRCRSTARGTFSGPRR